MYLVAKFFLILYLFSSCIFPLEIIPKENNDNLIKNLNDANSDLSLNNDDYILGPGDIFKIDFVGNNLLFNENNFQFEIIKTGSAFIPLIGEVYLDGLSISESYNILKSKFAEELINPEFNLTLISGRSVQFSIVGEVRSPGIYTLSTVQPDSLEKEFKRVVDAILESGGLTKNSNIRNIELVRKIPESKGGGYKKAQLDLYDLVFNGNHSQNPILFDGDFIKVNKVDSLGRLPKTNFTNTLIEVQVVGEVAKPGKILIKNGTQLTQAIYYAGGPTDLRSNTKNVELLRTNPNGSITFKKYNTKIKNKNPNFKNPILEDGDIIRVSPTTFAKASDIIQATATPALNIFALYRLFE